MAEQILTAEYSEEMQKSYLDYSMSVITSRAVPDIRDGLKPVQRRVLFDMNELHASHDRPTYKSARICGDTMGKYHPHGDASIYDTLVVLAQDFKKMNPLVEGQGNFGSIEGDSAAAPRYTEARLQYFTDECMLKDLEMTVNFRPNYDESLKEPEVLPARIPYFLLNGSEGIAVGMATSTPSHNLGEIVDLALEFIKHPDMETSEMLTFLKGPDFPTGGIVANKKDLLEIYRTGQGRLRLRGRMEFEKKSGRSDHDRLVITEIPYTMIGQGIMKFMQDTAQLTEDKVLPEVIDISNQSDKNGIRIVLELKSGADIERIKNVLYKKTKLEDTFSVNMLAINDGKPETMTLRGILRAYVRFQYEILDRKYRTLLNRELEKKEIQDGLIKACDLIDGIVALLRSSKTRPDARKALMTGEMTTPLRQRDSEFTEMVKSFSFTERQADAILDMKLSRLIGLEILDLKKQHQETLKKIKEYRAIISSKERMNEVLSSDLQEIKKTFGTDRRTALEDSEEIVEDISQAAFSCYYLQDKFGYCRLIDEQTYQRNQEAAGELKILIPCKNTDTIIFFTDHGKMHQLRCQDVPLTKFREKGIPVDNISKYQAGTDDIIFAIEKQALQARSLLFITRKGLVKMVETGDFDTKNRMIMATSLLEDDQILSILPLERQKEIVLETEKGYFLKFPIQEIPFQKKTSKGVSGIKLDEGDILKAFYFPEETAEIERNGKKISLQRLKTQKRGAKGTKH